MKCDYVVVLNPSRYETLLQCFKHKVVGDLSEATVYSSQSIVETPENIFRLLDIKRLDAEKLRGLRLDGVIVCKTLENLIPKDLSRYFRTIIKRTTLLKEIIYI